VCRNGAKSGYIALVYFDTGSTPGQAIASDYPRNRGVVGPVCKAFAKRSVASISAEGMEGSSNA